MKEKLTVITLLLVMLLVLTSCSLNGGAVVADQCAALDGSARDNCYSESTQCSKIKNTQFRDSCVARLATQKNDVKVCDLIVTSKTMGFCQQQIAVQQDNFELCKKIADESWQDICYYNIATARNNVDECSYIADFDY